MGIQIFNNEQQVQNAQEDNTCHDLILDNLILYIYRNRIL
ncbi:MAG: hypothetical protein ACI8RD_006137 [Bacillariaceae sp.]|jgi:hypothetical protein